MDGWLKGKKLEVIGAWHSWRRRWRQVNGSDKETEYEKIEVMDLDQKNGGTQEREDGSSGRNNS